MGPASAPGGQPFTPLPYAIPNSHLGRSPRIAERIPSRRHRSEPRRAGQQTTELPNELSFDRRGATGRMRAAAECVAASRAADDGPRIADNEQRLGSFSKKPEETQETGNDSRFSPRIPDEQPSSRGQSRSPQYPNTYPLGWSSSRPLSLCGFLTCWSSPESLSGPLRVL